MVEKSVAVTWGMWLMTSGLLLLPGIPLSGRCRFIDNSSEWLELIRSRRNAAAAAARLSNWLTVAPAWPDIDFFPVNFLTLLHILSGQTYRLECEDVVEVKDPAGT